MGYKNDMSNDFTFKARIANNGFMIEIIKDYIKNRFLFINTRILPLLEIVILCDNPPALGN